MHAPRKTILGTRRLAVLAALLITVASPTSGRRPLLADDEGPIRNSAPLPATRSAEDSLASGDASWARAVAAEPQDRSTQRNQAFDAWREALLNSSPGDGVRLASSSLASPAPGQVVGPNRVFADPDNTHARRAEGVAEAVIRRLAALSPDDRSEWKQRFDGLARAAWERSLASRTGLSGDLTETRQLLSRLERNYPLTDPAGRAALALFDLALEAGRPTAAGAWLARAARHRQLSSTVSDQLSSDARAKLEAQWEGAIARRRGALTLAMARWNGQDHTQPPPISAPAPKGTAAAEDAPTTAQPGGAVFPALITTQRLSGISRRSDEPFGLGLSTGIAFFGDGAAVVQGAHGILSLIPDEDDDSIAIRLSGAVRSLYTELFGIYQPESRAAPSSGGWPSLPASDGQHVAMVMGRGTPAQSLRDVEIAATGNTIGVCAQGPKDRPLRPLWVVRDGLVALDPAGQPRGRGGALDTFGALTDVFTSSGVPLQGWDLGPGWEFQPGPVIADGTVFVLARGLGSGDDMTEDRTDEVRLLALDVLTGALRWSASVTKERGLLVGNARGEAGYFAATTMPLTVHRTSGTVLVGTNSGLLAAFGAAEGRLLWAFRNQRRAINEGGWPGSRSPLLVSSESGNADVAWFAPFDSGFAYPLPAGPAPLDGSLFREAPRARGSALDLAAVVPPKASQQGRAAALGATQGIPERSTLLLLGRYARYSALLIDAPGDVRQPAAYLAPGDRFGGQAALDAAGKHLWVAGTAELSGFAAASDFGLVKTAPIASQGAGTGGDAVQRGDFLYILGRDTVWVYSLGRQ